MSLLDDYEKISQSQDIAVFKEVLDSVLVPILIGWEDRFIHQYNETQKRLDVLTMKVEEMRCCLESKISKWEMQDNMADLRKDLHEMYSELGIHQA